MKKTLKADDPASELSFLGKWAAIILPFIYTLGRYLAMLAGVKLPDWVPPELKTDAFWVGLIVTVIVALYGMWRTWRKRVQPVVEERRKRAAVGLGRTITQVTLLLFATAMLTGCASPYDGVRRGPFLHYSINKAYRIAEEMGVQPVQMGSGSIRWVYKQQLRAAGVPEFSMTMNAAQFADFEQKCRAVAQVVGKSNEQIVNTYNPGGKAWAIFGEGSLWSSVTAGIAAMIVKWTEGDDGGDSPKPSANPTPGAAGGIVADTVNMSFINGDNNQTSQNTGEGGRGR